MSRIFRSSSELRIHTVGFFTRHRGRKREERTFRPGPEREDGSLRMLLTPQPIRAPPPEPPSESGGSAAPEEGGELFALFSFHSHVPAFCCSLSMAAHAVATVTGANDPTACWTREQRWIWKPAETLRRECKTLQITSGEVLCDISRPEISAPLWRRAAGTR